MTTTTPGFSPSRPAGRTVPDDGPGPLTQLRFNFVSEWTKLRSVRSTVLALLATVVMTVGFAVLLCLGELSRWDHLSAHQRATFKPATLSVSGALFAELVIGALGVLSMSAEYSTGTIRATLTATPQRLVAYLAKIVTFAVTAFAVTLPTSVLAFLTAQAILARRQAGVGLLDGDDPRVVVGAALFLVAVALLGLGLAATLRHTAGAISTLFGLMLVLPLLSNFLPSDWQAHVDRWLPLNAGMAVMEQGPPQANGFDPWTGLGVLFGYALIALLAGGVLLRHRDA